MTRKSARATGRRTEPRTLTGAQIVWECLTRERVSHVFGYPGGAILPVYFSSRGGLEYYLGTYLAHKQRYPESLEALSKAEKKGLKFDVLYRNLAVLYSKYKNDGSTAEAYYHKAIGLAKDDFNHYLELISLYTARDETKKVHKTIEKLPEKFARTIPEGAGLVLDYLSRTGNVKAYHQALKQVDLSGWEGKGRYIHFTSRMQAGKGLYEQGAFEQALEEFTLAEEYPENFGTGAGGGFLYTRAKLNLWKGLCLKKLDREQEAVGCFESAASEFHQVFYFESIKFEVSVVRFYQSLALNELGRIAQAQAILEGVNYYRERTGLTPLRLQIEDENLMNVKKVDGVNPAKNAGPEI